MHVIVEISSTSYHLEIVYASALYYLSNGVTINIYIYIYNDGLIFVICILGITLCYYYNYLVI